MVDINKLLQTIQKIESNGVHNALGDKGRALGSFQFHPEAFWDWSDKPRSGMTWDEWFWDTAKNFFKDLYQEFPSMPPEEAAVVYHQHCIIMRAQSGDMTKDDYADRFLKEWNK